MVFSSIIFLFLFLPVTLLVYFPIGKRFRNLFLLAASLFFYAWGETFYVLIMLASICANYIFGLMIARYGNGTKAKLFLGFAVTANLGLLIVFKYTNFLIDNFNQIFASVLAAPIQIDPVHLPIGISFFTFQAMTYVVDVYRKEAPVQKNPVNIGLYISLFPQLIAGPIVRYNTVAGQIISRSINLKDFAEGIERFIFGLGKKVLIANSVAVAADKIFAIPSEHLTFSLAWMGILCYTLQIYFDFSGYSDMAIGLGRMFGFTFPENFNYPYLSKSIREFWKRWHISLSTWFRDYLYIPLGGNKLGTVRTYANLVTVFFLCGLWHGASWNFVIWGLLHGLFLVLERIGLEKLLDRIWSPIQYLYTLLVVMTCWVFFRAETLPDALSFIAAMFGFARGDGIIHHTGLYLDNEIWLTMIAGIIFSAPIFPFIKKTWSTITKNQTGISGNLTEGISAISGISSLILIFLASIMSLAAGAYNPFIYFRF
ncbi:MAG: MBOAT family protein [Desulfobacteraceae bacterium]|nr:MAG: MBOAT family protein [Desulfobacteraceae bacterium]